MSNFFSSSTFHAAAARAFFPGRTYEARTVAIGAYAFDVLMVGSRARADLPFLDFLEPRAVGEEGHAPLSYLPAVSTRSVLVETWGEVAGEGLAAAPWVDWAKISSWDDYVARARGQDGQLFDRGARKSKRLSKERGPLAFELASRSRPLIDLCMRWKSQQYRDSKLPDLFARPRVRALFHALFDAGALMVSALYAGASIPLAIHLGVLHEGRFYYWVPAFDRSQQQGSPGALLLEHMLEASWRERHRSFEFLVGDESYKFRYSTDVRVVAPIGTPPLLTRAWRPLRQRVVAQLRDSERLYLLLKTARRRVAERGWP